MKARHAAMMAGLALGLMSGVAHAAIMTTTYTVNYTVTNGQSSEEVTGFIKTDGATDRALTVADIQGFSLMSGGLSAAFLEIEGSSLSASTDGTLNFTFGSNFDFVHALADDEITSVAEFNGLEFGSNNIYAYNGVRQSAVSGQVFTIGIAQVSAVPLPSSAPMFGAALMALGAVGYGLKRKGKAAAV